MNFKSFLILMSLSTTVNANLEKKWVALNKDFSIDSSKQSFCLQKASGEIIGKNIDLSVTIASVSKLLTSLWAIDALGPDYEYDTKFYMSGKRLHISGSLDPVFSKRKLFFLVNQLNNLGINELEEITFDEGVKVFTKAERYVGYVLQVTPARTAANLKDFLHTPGWNNLKAAYKEFVDSTPQKLMDGLQMVDDLEKLNLKVGRVRQVKENPLGSEGFIHLSPAITVYLKFMNIASNNYIADQVFEKLGGEKGFDKYFEELLPKLILPNDNDNQPIVKMYTGSGLDSKRKGARVDNTASCRAVTEMIKRLDQILIDAGNEIQKVVAVPGVDGGTFSSRLRSPRLSKTLVAKTGTLFHTSALAGKVNASTGPAYFGIFHQLTGWKGNAKAVQNKMVDEMVTELNGQKFDYQPRYFFPADRNMTEL